MKKLLTYFGINSVHYRFEMGIFVTYTASDGNGQNFVLYLQESNRLSNTRNILFTKQSTTGVAWEIMLVNNGTLVYSALQAW